MFRKTLRVLAVLALVTLTTTGAANAANSAGRSFSGLEVPGLSAVWERIAGWLGSLAGRPDGRREAVTKAGSSMDPNGGPPAGTSSDEGSQMDPNGR